MTFGRLPSFAPVPNPGPVPAFSHDHPDTAQSGLVVDLCEACFAQRRDEAFLDFSYPLESFMASRVDVLRLSSVLHAIKRAADSEGIVEPATDRLAEVRRIAARLLDSDTSIDAVALLDELLMPAYARMASCAPHESFGWRRVYTDASVLRAVMWLYDDAAREAIALLDKAIVLAGAPGDGRLDLILGLIARIQAAHFDDPQTESPDMFSAVKAPSLRPINTAACAIPRLHIPPSFSSFVTTHSQKPFILSGHALEWPALSERPWSSKAYLRSVAGRGRQVPVEIGDDYRSDSWTQRIMDWDEFLNRVDSQSEVLYLAQHDLFKQLPELLDDLVVPDYVYASLSPSSDFPEYRPPDNDQQLIMNVWLGPGGATSPAHTDPFHNLYVQVVGQKTVWLAPPSATPSMFAFGGAAAQAHNPAANREHADMSNTSRLDVFAPREVSESTHPAFARDVVPRAMSATLQPGDILFFPAGWWHAMRSESTSFSVSMWF